MELLAIVCLLIWIGALVMLCSRRDVEINEKLSWVVAILVLNVFGAILYCLFGPKLKTLPTPGDPPIDSDTAPMMQKGKLWNPIIGENHMAEGEGFNSRDIKTSDQDPDAKS